jgi:predicted DNA-binding transcriptional regulator AlpA
MSRELPYWPLMMRRTMAARYCDLTVAEFEREIVDGRLPHPVKLGNHEHWSRVKIDQAIERMHGGGTDWRSRSKLYRDVA